MTLPSGWSRVPLRDLIADGPSNGYSPQSGGDARGALTLKLSATSGGRLRLDDTTTKRIYEDIPRGSKFWLAPGDILVQRANSLEYLGTAAMYDGPSSTYIYPDLMMRVRPGERVDGNYLCRFLNAPATRQKLRDKATGTAGNMPKINGETLRSLLVDFPPLGEQRRIVAKLEALQARSRRAREALEAVPPLLEKLRQSILAAAFRGDLTKDWRAKHPDVEPASELLKRIRVERRKRWEEAELAKMRAKGKDPTQDSWKGKFQEPQSLDVRALPQLPNGWCWTTAETLSEASRPIIYGIIKAGPDVAGGVPYVRVTEVAAGRIVLDELPRCAPERAAQFGRSVLAGGDILVSKDGTIGKVAFVPPELAGGNINQHVLRVAAVSSIDRFYLARMIESPSCQAWMKGEIKGIALQGVNVEDFRRMPVPVAPRAEQASIVRAVDTALARLRRFDILGVSRQLAALEAATLAIAFRGDLVEHGVAAECAKRTQSLPDDETQVPSAPRRPRPASASEGPGEEA